LLLVAGAIAFIELRLDAAPVTANSQPASNQPDAEEQAGTTPAPTEDASGPIDDGKGADTMREPSSTEAERAVADTKRIADKDDEYRRAEEIQAPSGFVNADGFSVVDAASENVILLEFWTYTCFNCQNVQPHINVWHESYADEGLRVVGVHTPEFEFEREYANVEEAVREAGIEYPVVLDNAYATWDAYDNRYWPAVYLIDADGFVRYKHFGEGAYGETEKKIEELLAERDRISG
jgi:thiol-disulfide isomerase/thioredoxin